MNITKYIPLNKLFYINLFFSVIVGAGSYFIFKEMFSDSPGDLIDHLNMIPRIANKEIAIPANFLYYLTIWLFSGCSLAIKDLIKTAQIVLPFFIVFKFIATKYAINYILEDINKYVLNFAALSLLIIMPIPVFLFINGSHYLGYLTPNVWHNSTTIFLMPFAILLFVESDKLLKQYSHSKLLYLLLLLSINILIKPSFLFVFLIAYPILAIKEIGINKKLIYYLVIPITGFLLVYIEYLLIYKYGNKVDATGGVKFSFMFAYHLILTKYVGAKNFETINGSFLYFIIALFFSGSFAWIFLIQKSIWNSTLVIISFLSVVIACIITIFVYEPLRPDHGNFLWQTYIAMYMFAMIYLANALKIRNSFLFKITFLLYLIHIYFGITYIYNLIVLNQIG